jgi:hypothetical protein
MPFLAEGTQQSWYAKAVDDSPEVVSHAREAEFSAHGLEPLHAAVALIIGGLDRAKRVFHELRSLLHDLGVGFEPLLHALENMLIDPAGDPSPTFVAGTLCLHGTAPACTGGIGAELTAALRGLTSNGQRLAARTPGAVLFWVVGEALFAKASQLGVG